MSDLATVVKAAKELLEDMRYVDFYHSEKAQRLYQVLTHLGVKVEVSGGVWSVYPEVKNNE